MKSNDWRGVAELIGIAAIVASLIFVGLQMRQEQEIAITETRSVVTQNIGELSSIISAYPGIWRRGLDGEDLSVEEKITFLTMIEAAESHIFLMYLRFRRLEIEGGNPDAFAHDFAYAVYIYPGLKSAYQEESDELAQRGAALGRQTGVRNVFRGLVEQKLAELERQSPPIPANKRYVFW